VVDEDITADSVTGTFKVALSSFDLAARNFTFSSRIDTFCILSFIESFSLGETPNFSAYFNSSSYFLLANISSYAC